MAKATFGATDLSPVYINEEPSSSEPYSGSERRWNNRRSAEDRRKEVRFDFDSSDRRKNPGRRSDDPCPKPW